MIHEELCERARRWLSGTRRCNPVYSRNASCCEIPDAIGWSSAYRWCGSTVLECKSSLTDFYADKKKRVAWRHPRCGIGDWYHGRRMSEKTAIEQGYLRVDVPLMGDFRFYFCLSGLITIELVEKHAPDHGLLWWEGRCIRVMREAPRRTTGVDKDAEIRYLRFAIINNKRSFDRKDTEAADGTVQLQGTV